VHRARELEGRQLNDRLCQVAHVDGTADLVCEERHLEPPVDGIQSRRSIGDGVSPP
jgi:hypothetical protein